MQFPSTFLDQSSDTISNGSPTWGSALTNAVPMMPPLVSSHFPSQFFRTLQQFRESRYLCDVRLIADGEIEFPAHRLVLAISSPFFSDLFQSKKDAQDVTTVHLRNCSADCVQILLQFLYSGELQLKECDPGKVLSVARACRIAALEQMLASYATTPPSPDAASPKVHSASPKHSPAAADQSHTHKRKATKASPAADQPQQPVKTEIRKTSSRNSFQSSQPTPSLLAPAGARLVAPTVPTPSSIFMQNGPTLCPIHGVFACGCPIYAIAVANGASTANPNDPAVAAALQQLFFGAAAAAAAAAAAHSTESSSNSKDSGHASNGSHDDESISGTAYGASLPKIARMSSKANGNVSTGIFGSQNGELHCQLPTTPANPLLSPQANAQRYLQQQAQLLGANQATLSTSATNRHRTTSDMASTTPETHQPQQQGGERGSLNTVQVPADDKEGWCRNKKYIKKTPQGYQCTVCKKTYGRYNSVSYHVTIYHRNPPIQCDQPGCTFSTREARYIHFHKYYRHDVALPTNIDLESRRCPFCKHVAKSPAMLEKHINRHMPECIRVGRTYHCDLCKKELGSRHALVQHMMAHENEKGLSCDQCSYRGRTAENLQQHKLFKHSNAGDLWCAKYQCPECQFSTPSKSQLTAHQRNVHQKDGSSNGVSSTCSDNVKEEDEDEIGSEGPNGKLSTMIEEGHENGTRLHSDSDEEFLMEHEEENGSNDEDCAFPFRRSGSDEIDQHISNHIDDDGQIGGSSSPTETSPLGSV